MGRHLDIMLASAAAMLVLLAQTPASADMLLKLKDGRTIAVPVSPGDIDSVTYGPAPKQDGPAHVQPARRAAEQIREDKDSLRRARDAEKRATDAAEAAEKAALEARKAADEARRQAETARTAREAAERLSRTSDARRSPRPSARPALRPALPRPAMKSAPAPHAPRIIKVGPGQQFAKPSAAAKAVRDGDTVEIAPGDYRGDVAVWRANDVTIKGVGGRPKLNAEGRAAERKAIWVITGNNYVVDNIEFSNCRVRDRNGAGIRFEGSNLTVLNSYFHDNEMGILVGHKPDSNIVIRNSEFYRNVVDYPKYHSLGHNIYIGRAHSFTLEGSYSHGARWGHDVKTRARVNRILYNRLEDGEDGGASYLIDVAEGGRAWIVGNVIEQGPNGDNWTMVSFASEKRQGGDEVALINNTMINNRGSGVFLQNHADKPALMINNILAGDGTPAKGPAELRANLIARSVSSGPLGSLLGGGGGKVTAGTGELAGNFIARTARFVDAGAYDFRLRKDSPARDRGAEPGMVFNWPARPVSEYVQPLKTVPRPRVGKIDIGAYEFKP